MVRSGSFGRVSQATDPQAPTARPVVAVVGRPNVGKSTLVNRILGRREAVVHDMPGVTRDRVSYDAEWAGREFVLVDTGGWVSDATGMAAQIAEQAEIAIQLADAVIFVVDATVGTTDADLQAALEAAANKDGDITPEMLAWAKAQLGID